MVMSECRLGTTEKAEILITLLTEKSDYPLMYYIDATKNNATLELARNFLNQPCTICFDELPMDEVKHTFTHALLFVNAVCSYYFMYMY